MHFSLLEKIGASVLICAWLIYGANFMGNTLVHVQEHHAAGGEEGAHAQQAAAPEPAVETDLGTLLAAATPEEGQKIFGKCKACHTIEEGGKAGVGPNLYNVVGGPKAHMEGFAYSDALASRHGETWSYENLNAFLTSPKDYVPGTKMSFPGLKDPAQRAAVIDYLRANTVNPPPLPEPAPKAAPVAAAEAPAEEHAAAPAAAPAEDAAPADIKTLMASADPAAGQKVFNKCKACHTADKGGRNGVGPNLYNVVGGPRAHMEGFPYSSAMAEHHSQTWTYDDLFVFLESPKDFVPGTKMTFAGLKNPEDRANVIAYLRSQSDQPVPLP